LNSKTKETLSAEEFKEMLKLFARHIETDLDQFATWKLDVAGRKIYIDISMLPAAEGAEAAYTDLTHLIS
jgi:hypothetical protein